MLQKIIRQLNAIVLSNAKIRKNDVVRADTHGLPPGRATGVLVVTVDDPEVKEIRVPLRVEVLGPPAPPSDPKGK